MGRDIPRSCMLEVDLFVHDHLGNGGFSISPVHHVRTLFV